MNLSCAEILCASGAQAQLTYWASQLSITTLLNSTGSTITAGAVSSLLLPHIILPAWKNTQLQNPKCCFHWIVLDHVKSGHHKSRTFWTVWTLCSWGLCRLNTADSMLSWSTSQGFIHRNILWGCLVFCLGIKMLFCRNLQWLPLISRPLCVMWSTSLRWGKYIHEVAAVKHGVQFCLLLLFYLFVFYYWQFFK